MERIIVTGGAGFIGTHLVKKLRIKYKVYVIDPKSTEPEERVDNIDTVFDLAALPLPMSLVEPYKLVNELYQIGLILCKAARHKLFKTLIHVSSSEVLNITTPYAAAKDAQDKLITSYKIAFGIDAHIVMPFNTYGPGQVWDAIIPFTIKRILKGERPIINGTGEHSRDLVYVDDTVKGIIDRKPIITTGECYSVNEIVERISKLMNYKGKPIHKEDRKGDTPNIHHERTLDKYVSLEEGLKRTIEWWKKQ